MKMLTRRQAASLKRPWRVTLYFRTGAVQSFRITEDVKDDFWRAGSFGRWKHTWITFQTENADIVGVSIPAVGAIALTKGETAQSPNPPAVLGVKLTGISQELEFELNRKLDEYDEDDDGPCSLEFLLDQSYTYLEFEPQPEIKSPGASPAELDVVFAAGVDGGGLFLFVDSIEWLTVSGLQPVPKERADHADPP